MTVRKIDCDDGFGCIFELTGRLDDAEVAEHFFPHLNDRSERGLAYRYTLVDVSALGEFAVGTDIIRKAARLAAEAQRVNSEAIVAFVVPQQVSYGLFRLFEANMGDDTWNTKAFDDRAEAEAWIRERAAERFGRGDLGFA